MIISAIALSTDSRHYQFSYDGDFVGEVKLMLLTDIAVPLWSDAELILHGGFDKESGRGVEKTYVSMDCSGFRELNVVADLVFSDRFICKVDAGDKPVTGREGRVSCAVRTTVSDWSDILLSVNMPRFAIRGLDGFAFDVKHAVFDFSEKRNDPSTQFPKNYEGEYLVPGHVETWKGVFVGQFKVSLPKQFAERDSDSRISFSANNPPPDNNGVSGILETADISARIGKEICRVPQVKASLAQRRFCVFNRI